MTPRSPEPINPLTQKSAAAAQRPHSDGALFGGSETASAEKPRRRRRATGQRDDGADVHGAVAAFVEEVTATGRERPIVDGRAANAARRALAAVGGDVAKFRDIVRVALGVGCRAPWPFGEAGAVNLPNLAKHVHALAAAAGERRRGIGTAANAAPGERGEVIRIPVLG